MLGIMILEVEEQILAPLAGSVIIMTASVWVVLSWMAILLNLYLWNQGVVMEAGQLTELVRSRLLYQPWLKSVVPLILQV